MIEYAILDRKKADVFRDYLPAEVYARRMEKNIFFYGASTKTEIVAVAAFDANTDAELLSISVSPQWQKQGVGSELIDCAGDFCKKIGVNTFSAIISGAEEQVDEWGHFLFRSGFELDDEESVNSFTIKNAMESELLEKARNASPEHVCALSKVPGETARKFGSYLIKNDLYYGWNSGRIDQNLSSVYLEDNQITACVLVSVSTDGAELTLEYAYVSPACRNKSSLIYLLGHSLDVAAKHYPADTPIAAIPMNDVSEKLISKLLGQTRTEIIIRRYEMTL